MNNGWSLIEKYVDKKINLELQLIELFILTITAEIVVISLSEYKKIVIPVLINIVAVCYLTLMLVLDLNMKKSEKTAKEFGKKMIYVVSIPFGFKDLIPLVLYITSIIIMGLIILNPYIDFSSIYSK